MEIPEMDHRPDFEQLLKVLRREQADRPVLFEFIINPELCQWAAPEFGSPEPGSGNSIPDFIPMENYMAMLKAARDFAG